MVLALKLLNCIFRTKLTPLIDQVLVSADEFYRQKEKSRYGGKTKTYLDKLESLQNQKWNGRLSLSIEQEGGQFDQEQEGKTVFGFIAGIIYSGY